MPALRKSKRGSVVPGQGSEHQIPGTTIGRRVPVEPIDARDSRAVRDRDPGARIDRVEPDFDLRRIGTAGPGIPVEHQPAGWLVSADDAELDLAAVACAFEEPARGLDPNCARPIV